MGEKASGLVAAVPARRTKPPPWRKVILTTFRLWLERRKATTRPSGPWRRPSVLLVLLMTGLVGAGSAIIVLYKPAASVRAASARPAASSAGQAGPVAGRAGAGSAGTVGAGTGSAGAASAGPAAVAVAQAQGAAAGWIADQVNSSAIVACDPAMCAALQAHGLTASRLLVLRLTAADPLGSDIVVATSAVRNQYGDRLATVYAPLVIAIFGSGPALIEVRLVAADGSAGFGSRVAAGQRDRIAAGEQLLRNKRITAAGQARAALTGGRVDVRLLVVLAALAAREPVRVIAFGDPSPGAAGMPLRSAQIGTQNVAALRSAFVFLRAQLPPYQAVLTRGMHNVLTIQFDAPSPLDLASGP